MMECVVWWARPGQLTAHHLGLLDATEHGRRVAYRRAVDRERFALGAVLVRLGVAALTGAEPARVRVDRTCPECGRPHGRPRVGPDVQLSVSHSGELVGVAVHPGAPVGLDVERVGDLDTGTLAGAVLGPGEVAGDRHEFLVTWTRKESVVKATGDGLRVPLPEVVVGPPGEPPRLVSYPGRPELVAAMTDLHPPGGAHRHRAALTVLSPTLPVVHERVAVADLPGFAPA